MKTALDLLAKIVAATIAGYQAEAQDDMPAAAAKLIEARDAMRLFQTEAEGLARRGIGIPFFAAWAENRGGA